jgi:hypothetical protein
MVDHHLTSGVNAAQFNCYMSFFDFFNHPFDDEARCEKTIARCPERKNVFISFNFDWIEQVCEWIVVGCRCSKSLRFKNVYHSVVLFVPANFLMRQSVKGICGSSTQGSHGKT